MYRDSTATRILAVLLIAALCLFSVGFTWAAVDDLAGRDVLPKGASIDGVSVGGMARADAVRLVEEKVEGPLLQPVTVTFQGAPYTVDPKEYVTVDVDGMLTEAAQPKVSATLPERVWARVSDQSYGHEVTRKLKIDTEKLAAWVAGTKATVTVLPIDAAATLVAAGAKFTSAKEGRTVDQTATMDAVSDALTKGTKAVELAPVVLVPRVTDAKLGKTIVISRSRTTLTLYNGSKVEKTFRCAVGTPGHPTPLGSWKVVNKRYMPSWSNPGSAWAASMPAYIPPGPGNPLGTRALDLDASGIRIHGTSANYSIGTAASHGCIRMHMWDVENLYPRVPLGTRVFVVR